METDAALLIAAGLRALRWPDTPAAVLDALARQAA
jgi:hypothetical protein